MYRNQTEEKVPLSTYNRVQSAGTSTSADNVVQYDFGPDSDSNVTLFHIVSSPSVTPSDAELPIPQRTVILTLLDAGTEMGMYDILPGLGLRQFSTSRTVPYVAG